MLPYIILATCPIIIAIFYGYAKRRGINYSDDTKKVFLVICGIALFLMVALRNKDNGSTDSYNYYNNWIFLQKTTYLKLDDILENTSMEKGYLITVFLLTRIFKDPQVLFVISGILFATAVGSFIYKNCEDVTISFFMYTTLGLYSFMVQGLRQAIAMSICLFSIEFVKKRKLIPFVLLVLLASAYHKSAMIFLIVYLLYYLKMNIAGYVIATIFSVVALICGNIFVGYAREIFDREYGDKASSGGLISVLIYAIILIVAVLFGGEKKKDKNFAFFFYFTWVGFVFLVMRYTEVVIIERISFYFAFGQMALLTGVVQNLDRREKIIVKYVVILLCIALFAYRLSSSDLIEYRFFWQT